MDELKAVIRDYVVKEYLEEGDDRTIEVETPLICVRCHFPFCVVSSVGSDRRSSPTAALQPLHCDSG